MKRSLLFSALFLLLISLVSCFHDWVTPVADRPVMGRWQWVFSIGGVGGDSIAPSENSLVTLTLNNDSTYATYLDNVAITGGKYSVTIDSNNASILHFDKPVQVDKLFLQKDQLIFQADSSQLQLFDYNITDGFYHHFKNIK